MTLRLSGGEVEDWVDDLAEQPVPDSRRVMQVCSLGPALMIS